MKTDNHNNIIKKTHLDNTEMNVRILIVDDDDTVRYLMNEFIETVGGYNTSTASDAEEAIALLEANNDFQVVITDIMMPGMDGLELTEKIKKDYDPDVIVMTGFSGDYSYEDAIVKGASDFVFKPVRVEELLLRIKRVLKERHLKKELQALAITDGLTKLYNSRHFYNELELEVTRSVRYSHPLSLLIFDIDNFKLYNEKYLHMGGDKVLSKIGQIVRSCLRRTDSAYRYGGDEFTVILPETNGLEAITVARRIKSTVTAEDFIPENGKTVKITISMGVTEYSPDEKSSTFIKRADLALLTSKQQGRDKITTLFCK